MLVYACIVTKNKTWSDSLRQIRHHATLHITMKIIIHIYYVHAYIGYIYLNNVAWLPSSSNSVSPRLWRMEVISENAARGSDLWRELRQRAQPIPDCADHAFGQAVAPWMPDAMVESVQYAFFWGTLSPSLVRNRSHCLARSCRSPRVDTVKLLLPAPQHQT